MLLEQRNPSVNWEPVPLDPSGLHIVWAWFRPAAIPQGLMLVVPFSVFSDPAISVRLSLRQLLVSAGLDPSQVLYWMLNGMSFDAAGGISPLLDQTVPSPASGANLEISVWMSPIQQPLWQVMPPVNSGIPFHLGAPSEYTSANGSDGDFRLLDAIDSCWNGVLQLEARVGTIRKELSSSISRLSSLNRDLSSDERRTCDSKDLQDWNEARRWLRDSLSVLSRSVKEIDVGTTSGAGQRHRFDEIYRNHVAPKIPFPGIQQAVNEFESYRKTVQNVVASAQANLARAGRDAEQRANSVLQKIGSKMRSARRK